MSAKPYAFTRVSRNAGLEPSRPFGDAERTALDPDAARAAAAEIRTWPGYSATPLHALPGLARALGVRSVWLKDESDRLGLGSFKALGGAYAVLRTLQDHVERETGRRPTADELRRGRARERAGHITVTAATAGNHGRAVAWGAQLFGCRCVIYLPAGASPRRAALIAGHGAEVVRVADDYDGAVRRAAADAESRGWHVISDTSYEGYERVPRLVAEGYSLLVGELLGELRRRGEPLPTHVMVQVGVGGLATGVCGGLWSALGPARPCFVAVEPWSADGIGRSLRAGRRVTIAGPFATRMGGLACGEPSPLAWRLLSGSLDWGLAIPDAPVEEAREALAAGRFGARVALGASGAAGIGALWLLVRLPGIRRLLGLGEGARVLALGTEGPLDEGGGPPRAP